MEIISSINLWKFPGIIVVNNHIVLLYQNIVIASNDTDVVVYVFNYACYFQNMVVKKIWIQYGASDKTRFIPVHINVSLALIQAIFHVDDHFWVQENWHPNN